MAADAQAKSHLDRWCAKVPRKDVASLAVAVFQPPTRLTNGALATTKQQGPDGGTGPAGNGPQCLTSLSEPTRQLALWDVFQPPNLTNSAWGTTGPAGRGPCLPAAGLHKQRLRHTKTAEPWGTGPLWILTAGRQGRGPQAWSVTQGPTVSLWWGRLLWTSTPRLEESQLIRFGEGAGPPSRALLFS